MQKEKQLNDPEFTQNGVKIFWAFVSHTIMIIRPQWLSLCLMYNLYNRLVMLSKNPVPSTDTCETSQLQLCECSTHLSNDNEGVQRSVETKDTTDTRETLNLISREKRH